MSGSLLVTGIGELVTNSPGSGDLLGSVADAAVAIGDGVVVWAGPEADLPDEHRAGASIDVGGRAVIPGFVDAHTHLVFGGDRSDEFARRLRGESYRQILAAGGGIHATVAATRRASDSDLIADAAARALRMLASGTTTVEVKSGYGLDTATEVRMLRAAAEVDAATPIDVVPTFLGAHVVDRGSDRDDYLRLVVGEMLPACAPLARFCDVFSDEGAFTVEEARIVLEAGLAHGLRPRIHADQLSHTGAAALAARLGAASADHLDHATPEDAAALREAGTVAVLLPGASFSLRSSPAPGRMLWDAGVTVALATDCNPGTSYVESMPLVVALACLEMGLTPAEALWGATRGGALALEMPDRGWIGPGAIGDLVVLDAPSHLHIPYRPGTALVDTVIKRGEIVAGLRPEADR
ncbi:MAG: imidazolonepropionase [Actinobacteria bacterium]|nr:imidazolonepropionase [Actinomycetota bacterium]